MLTHMWGSSSSRGSHCTDIYSGTRLKFYRETPLLCDNFFDSTAMAVGIVFGICSTRFGPVNT